MLVHLTIFNDQWSLGPVVITGHWILTSGHWSGYDDSIQWPVVSHWSLVSDVMKHIAARTNKDSNRGFYRHLMSELEWGQFKFYIILLIVLPYHFFPASTRCCQRWVFGVTNHWQQWLQTPVTKCCHPRLQSSAITGRCNAAMEQSKRSCLEL